jgi:hypothetical protein
MIGSLSTIVPVTMRANTPPSKQRLPAEPDIGLRWGKQSQFTFSAQTPPDNAEQGPTQPLPFVRLATKHKYETRIETIPTPNWIQKRIYKPSREDHFMLTQGGVESSSGRDEIDGEDYEYQIDLGEEAQQEIAGFTAYPDGSVVERYKTILVHRRLSVGIDKTPSSPLPQGLGETEGEHQ